MNTVLKSVVSAVGAVAAVAALGSVVAPALTPVAHELIDSSFMSVLDVRNAAQSEWLSSSEALALAHEVNEAEAAYFDEHGSFGNLAALQQNGYLKNFKGCVSVHPDETTNLTVPSEGASFNAFVESDGYFYSRDYETGSFVGRADNEFLVTCQGYGEIVREDAAAPAWKFGDRNGTVSDSPTA